MIKYQDFTIDVERFNITEMSQIFDTSNDEGLHYIPIIDAGIALNSDSAARLEEMDCGIRSRQREGKLLVGSVWPGDVWYPDFNHPNASAFWEEGIANISRNYNWRGPDGLWIDMNEFANFVNGEKKLTRKAKMAANYTNLPFNPSGDEPMITKALSLDAYHYAGADSPFWPWPYVKKSYIDEFHFHNLNGFAEGIATYKALKSLKHVLTFIVTRASASGSGRYVQHWTGDNNSTWYQFKLSISEVLNNQLYGIPMVGADICGFAGNTTPELCVRWNQLGAWYPFTRNHNAIDSID